ncbi:Hypothetical protein NCS54_00867900 [Fusarium falciforme]|uniref:Hypothetical protein n=1 Tax=Fusarium falciforme TaxID=195108 RepID=UPI002301D52E|nr:Hypothetical protein NCS54_00867900 [Fusarium falciforme]WAO91219.1 Hypothetical protein NCS54_00867900 [Fusarium falciforme]
MTASNGPNGIKTPDFPPGVQRLPATAPPEHFIALLKRDGGVIAENFVPLEVIDKCNADIKPKLDAEQRWNGDFFPKETRKCTSLIANSTTYTTELLMHPLYQAICDHFLTTRNSFWWGDKWKESVSKPQAHTGAAMYIGPGAKAQPLHRDDYLHHNVHTEVPAPWDDERDKNRESAVGLFVAGTNTNKANGATRFIPGSHLWGNYERKSPPDESKTVHAELNKGDAFFMFASCFHGGSANTTTDSYRLVYSTFVTRGWLRQEDNMYLAIPRDVLMRYPRHIQRFIGYSCSDPGCGLVDDLDPMYTLYPEELKTAVPTDY